MDNVCHTLVGLALGEAGLKRRTARGTVTLAIAANLPDLDALLYLGAGGTTALAWRRGWTHGVLALVVLPLLLALAVAWWDRVARSRRARRGRSPGAPASVGSLALLAMVGVWSHSFLDWLNSYGVRLLMPLDGRWFYGDAVFIVDPWLWLALGVGVALAARRRRGGHVAPHVPARWALGVAGIYVAALVGSAALARVVVEDAARTAGAPPARRVMAGPVPVTPFRREIVRDLGDEYELGMLEWLPTPRYVPFDRLRRNADTPAARAAARTRQGRDFLAWSRFPLFAVDSAQPGRVRLSDARYDTGARGGWASVTVDVR
ncbi:MAG: metal-dependent hydrolase [Gemmatirosa sp.]